MKHSVHTILIVDDTPANITVLGDLLSDKYRLMIATNGRDALDIVSKHLDDIDLILLDVMMPEMDGYTTIRELKTNPKTRAIPVIFLTARTATDDVVKGFELGAIDYVTKPFNPFELKARVQTQIKLKHQQDVIREVSTEQRELLHVLSHDLANHFGIIQMSLQMTELADNIPLDKYKDKISIATKNGVDVIELVREMRAAEDKSLQLEPVNLSQAIASSMSLLQDKLSNKKITLETSVAPSLNVFVERRSFINSVINNILTNAIKFSEPDSAISISAAKSGKTIELKIKDHGIGIPDTIIEKLFDVSQNTSRTGTIGEQGTGFGMPLMKKFVEQYGGSISVNSQTKDDSPADHGTEIVLILPKG